MNTERLAVLLLGLLLLACSTSEDGPANPPPLEEGVDTRYTIVLSEAGSVTGQDYTANGLDINPVNGATPLEAFAEAALSFRDQESFSFLHTLPDCSAEINFWKTGETAVQLKSVFQEAPDCERQLLALAHNSHTAFVAYSEPGEGPKNIYYRIRSVSLDDSPAGFGETSLDYLPLRLISSASRIFVLTFDFGTGKNALEVIDSATGHTLHQMDLGTEVLSILKNPDGNILVSYTSRHLEVDANSLETISRVQYTSGKEPRFGDAIAPYFDPKGRLYYAMPTNLENSNYDHIPAVYDFANHTAYLYYYENFLSEETRSLYNIGDTMAVGFDHHNGYILIGYRKSGTGDKGGLLRIKPIPDPRLIDKTELHGLPLHIAVQ